MRFTSIILILAFFFSFSAKAVDAVVCELNGNKYVGFADADAQKLLQISIDFPKLQDALTILKDLNTNLTLQRDTLNTNINNLTEQNKIMTKLNTDLQTKIEDQNAWWRSPWLWFAVGVVIGTGVTLVIFWEAKK